MSSFKFTDVNDSIMRPWGRLAVGVRLGDEGWQKTHEGLLYHSCEGKGPWANSCEGRAQSMSKIRKSILRMPLTPYNTSDYGWRLVVEGNLRNARLKILFSVGHLPLFKAF